MKLHTLRGCWYCDTLPSGEYCAAQYGGGVLTNGGTIHGHELQWLRLAPDGVRFAGTDAVDPTVWEWTGTWQDRGTFVAPRAVIYQGDGALWIERSGGWPGTGSQGWRYVDDAGVLVPAWSTYADKERAIYEYTTRRDVTIGQGEQGVEAIFGTKRVRLDHLFDVPLGRGTFAVNFNRRGNDYAISWYVAHSPTDYTACLLWLSDAELRTLPTVGTTLPDPGTHPLPTPEPPTMLLAPNETATVRRVFAAHPEIDTTQDATRGRLLDYIGAALASPQWGRKRKGDGSLNTDVLAYLRADGLIEYYDVIDGTTGGPTWDGTGPFRSGSNGTWTPAQPVPDPEIPDSEIPNAPGPTIPTAGRVIGAMLDARFAALEAALAALRTRMSALETEPAPDASLSIDGLRVALRTADGHVLTAEDGGGGAVNATRAIAGGWETFQIEVME